MSSTSLDHIDPSGLAKVDQQLATLEENISKLKASLRHWQNWEIDYEGLKEEFSRLDEDCTDEEILVTARDFNAEALDETEIRSLVQASGSSGRRKTHLIDRLAKRIDYVVRNANSIRTQLSNAQKKRNTLLLAESSEHRIDAALPLTEITEELDDDGKIISSSTKTPKNTTPELAEILQKAGVEDIEVLDGVVKSSTSRPSPEHHLKGESGKNAKPKDSSKAGRSEVSSVERAGSEAKTIDSDNSGSKIVPDAEPETTSPVFSVDESPEDALLRREMLEYTPDEVGAVVAQLEIDADSGDNDSDLSVHDLMDEDDLRIDDSEDSDTFDEFGRSLISPITEEYRQEMLALERKLNARSMRNLGPSPSYLPEQIGAAMDEQTSPDASSSFQPNSPKTKAKKSSKKVSFAKDLDIAPRSADKKESQKPMPQHTASAVSNTLPERIKQPSNPPPPMLTGNDSRISRFRASRSTNVQSPRLSSVSTQSSKDRQDVPDATLSNKLQSDIVVERPLHFSKSANRPPNSYELDTALHRKEVRGEFHRMRSRMIQQQGGFTEQPDPQEEVPVSDESEKKISRFKAARMK